MERNEWGSSATIREAFTRREPEVQATEPQTAAVEPDAPEESPWLPEWVWNEAPYLANWRRWCLSRGFAPDPTAFAVLARHAAFLPKGTSMNTGLGDPQTPLNLLVSIIGKPGGGKSSALTAASLILPTPDYAYSGIIGSGEGLEASYMGEVEVETGKTKKDGTPIYKTEYGQARWNSFLWLDEGEELYRLDERKGALIMPQLRAIWLTSEIGRTNAGKETNRKVLNPMFGCVIGWQPKTIHRLLGAEVYGTPQRFLFCRCNPNKRPSGENIPTPELSWDYRPRRITFHKQVREELIDTWEQQDKTDDAYAPREMITRCKVAGNLAFIEESNTVSPRIWRIAGAFTDTSKAGRLLLMKEAEAAQQDADAQNIVKAATRAEAITVASRSAENNAKRDEERLLMLIDGKRTKARAISDAFGGQRRALGELAFSRLVDQGKVIEQAGVPPHKAETEKPKSGYGYGIAF